MSNHTARHKDTNHPRHRKFVSRGRDDYRKLLENFIEYVEYWTGIGRIYRKMTDSHGAIILMYHSIPDPERAIWIDPTNTVPSELFEQQIHYLYRNRRVISMSELVDAISHKKNIEKETVVVTFDDGYLDNLEVAAPILKHYDMPATLYLPTGYISREETQWIDQLYTMFRYATCDQVNLTQIHTSEIIEGDISHVAEKYRIYRRIGKALISASYEKRQYLLSKINEQLRPEVTPPRLTLNWVELQYLIDTYPNIEIGAHTVDHIDISKCSEEEAHQEIENSIKDIEKNLNERPKHYSFPYGRSTEAHRNLIRELGMKSAVIASSDIRINSNSDPYALARIESPYSKTFFRYRTSGSYPLLTRV